MPCLTHLIMHTFGQGFPFHSRTFFTAQLSLLDPDNEERSILLEQQQTLLWLADETEGVPHLILCLDGTGGGDFPLVEYKRIDSRVSKPALKIGVSIWH